MRLHSGQCVGRPFSEGLPPASPPHCVEGGGLNWLQMQTAWAFLLIQCVPGGSEISVQSWGSKNWARELAMESEVVGSR